MMKIAGFFHDIGKLIVPLKILHKTGRLSRQEWAIMRTHTYYTYQALSTAGSLARVKEWGAFHHEKLNGEGYPFHLREEELSAAGSRIMAVADVFTAVAEDRPYQEGMPPEKIKGILQEMADRRELDKDIAAVVNDNFAEFKETRDEAQSRAEEYYQDFKVRISEYINYEF